MLALRHGHNYTVFLRVYNRAGGVRELSSNGVTVDTTPPKPSEVTFSSSEWRFNPKTGIYYSSTASGIHVSWRDFEERESEVWYYKWAIGTTKCGTQLQPFINIGLTTRANTSRSNLEFRPGVPYYVTVMARNRADLVSRACSTPVLFDYTPPRVGTIRVTSHTGTEKMYFRSDEDVTLSWSDFDDPESGIEKYEISVMASNTSVVNTTRSGEQTEFEISLAMLSARRKYTVVVTAINYAGLETKVYSKPFTIDDTIPFYTGIEEDLPRRRYLSNPDSFKVTWKRFADAECPIEFYEIGIGTQTTRGEFTRTGLCTEFEFKDLGLRENQVYYVTVLAYNVAGLATSLLLETVLVDQSPPTGRNGSVKDGITGDDVDYISPDDPLSATWVNLEDPESGIAMFEYCVGSTRFNCLIKPFTPAYKNTSFVCQECKTKADMKFFARIRVTNKAGLSAIFTSDGVTVDSSPPEIGRVLDGQKAESPDAEKVDRDWLPAVTWYGAQDVQSGLKECQWIIERHDGNANVTVYEKTLDHANITYNVRHTEITSVPLQLTTNASYFNVIRCSNNAGITSYQYSNGWSVVDKWPMTSHVLDGTGSRDLEYDVVGDTVGASWEPFYGDSKDPIIGYEWAVGTLGTPDNILDFTDVGLNTRGEQALSDSEIELEPGVRYYVTVRATTLSGRTSNKSSNGFVIDRTPPVGGVVKVPHKILNQERMQVDYTLTWSGFSDLETGIRSYEYCLGYIKDVCSTALTSAGLALQGTVQHFKPADADTPFFGVVIATNKAGLKITVSSNAIKVDVTPPLPGTVINGLEEDLDYINLTVSMVTTWSEFTDPETAIEKCTLTINEEDPLIHNSMTTIYVKKVNASGSITHSFILIPGLKYVSTIECVNSDGFKSSASSDGVVVDETPPIAGSISHGPKQAANILYQSSKNTLEAHWSPGRDPESGISEYWVAVGTGPNNDDVYGLFTVGLATYVKVGNLSMNSGSTYYVTLEIVNKAQLRTRISSSGVTVDDTPPVLSKVKLASSQTAPGFIGPGEYLNGNWNSYDDESSIAFTEYCIGTTTGGCQTRDMLRLPDNQTSVTCFDCKLEHRHTYFMTIRVWNEAGLFSLASTEGVTVDLTPPVTGEVLLNQRYMSCSETCSLSATFGGFIDEESGVKRCEFTVETSNGSLVTPAQVTTSENLIEAMNLTLKHGQSYKIAVICRNRLDERSSEADSPIVTIDNTPPEKGLVIISPDSNHDTRAQHTGCHFLNTTLRVYWTGFHDKESHLTGFRVAIGRAPLEHDIIPYQDFQIDSEAKFELSERYGLSQGDTIFATVEATNGAGLKTKVSSQPTRLISDTDDNLLNEQDFLCANF